MSYNTHSATSDSAGAAHPFFANHPTQTYAGSTNDIVIGASRVKPKMNKKPLVIGGVVLVIIVIILIIIFAVVGNSPKSQLGNLRQDFNKYANYFLYNTNSSANIEGVYQYGDRYWLANLDITSEQISEHFQTSETKYQDFYKAYQNYNEKHPNIIKDDVQEIIESYYADLDLLQYVTLYPNLDVDSILEVYVQTPDQVMNLAEGYYGNFQSSSVETTRQYALDYVAKISALITAYRIYDNAGCINTSRFSIDSSCRQSAENTQLTRANETYDVFLDFYSEQSNQVNELLVKPYQNIWYISRGLQ